MKIKKTPSSPQIVPPSFLQVTIMNESHYPDWNVSEFRIMRGDTVRTIRHFHFTTWPDFGVPEPPQTLVRFVRAFRERVSAEQRPIVVHCSAGVGRSGTFIALDRILQVSECRRMAAGWPPDGRPFLNTILSSRVSANQPEVRQRRHLRNRLRDAKGARLDGADRATIHLHPSVSAGSAGGS